MNRNVSAVEAHGVYFLFYKGDKTNEMYVCVMSRRCMTVEQVKS